MYLSELNIGQKKNFLELAKYAMNLDSVQKDQEMQVYSSFVQECGLQDYQVSKQESIKSVIKVLSQAELKVKRIVMIELFGILLADKDFCDEEVAFVNMLATEFNIDTYECNRLQRWVEAMNDLVSEGYALIFKEEK